MSTINRWDSYQDMLSLREAMQQLFEDSFVSNNVRRGNPSFVPAMDVSETADGFVVEAAVPGLKPKNIDITLENNILTIRGESQQEQQTSERSYHRIERRYGSFQRTINLPSTVRSDAISAELADGVLRLSIPKAEAVKPRKISVNSPLASSTVQQLEVGSEHRQAA